MSTQNTPGIYAKGETRRIARSASKAVALAFEGFKRTGDLPDAAPEVEASDTPQPEPVDSGKPAPSIFTPRPRPPVTETTEA